MFRKTALFLVSCMALAACAQEQPRIVQPTANAAEIHLEGGMATQVEIPAGGRVQSVVVGNPDLISASHDNDVVNLVPKNTTGETNLIVRAKDRDGDPAVYQYRVVVTGH